MLRPALIVVLALVVLVAVVWGFQRRLIYFPSRASVPAAGSVISGAADVTLRTSDGLALGAWFVPAQPPERRIAVLVANGNGGDRAGRAPLARALARQGLDVLLFDYRGYGGNPGSPTEQGLARDVRAAREALLERARVAADRLILFGDSLGTAVISELASEHPPAALVLRSPFTDLASVGRVHYPFLPVRLMLRDRYPTAERLAQIDVPTVIALGTHDSVVPPEHSRAVAAAARGATRVVEIAGADHNDPVLLAGDPLIEAVIELADRIDGR